MVGTGTGRADEAPRGDVVSLLLHEGGCGFHVPNCTIPKWCVEQCAEALASETSWVVIV